jgi:uncharacterized coiled-coil protein SlyX
LSITCKFYIREGQFTGFGNIYACDATISFSDGDQVQVKYVNGTHMSGKSNADVQSFNILNQENVVRVPRELYQYFPNLEVIYFYKTGLKEITSDDFINLSKLVSFDFNPNKIETIGNDVFKHQGSNIRSLSFHGNPIKNIGINVFSRMSNLQVIHFGLTPCANVGVNGDNARAIKVVNEAALKCPPSPSMFLQYVNELEMKLANANSTNESLKEEVVSTKIELNGLKIKISNQDYLIKELSNQLTSTNTNVETLSNDVSDLKSRFDEIVGQCCSTSPFSV